MGLNGWRGSGRGALRQGRAGTAKEKYESTWGRLNRHKVRAHRNEQIQKRKHKC